MLYKILQIHIILSGYYIYLPDSDEKREKLSIVVYVRVMR